MLNLETKGAAYGAYSKRLCRQILPIECEAVDDAVEAVLDLYLRAESADVSTTHIDTGRQWINAQKPVTVAVPHADTLFMTEFREDEGLWIARSKRWPWCTGHGATEYAAVRMMQDNLEALKCANCGAPDGDPGGIDQPKSVAPAQTQAAPLDVVHKCNHEVFGNNLGTTKAIVCSCGFAITYTFLSNTADQDGLAFFHHRHEAFHLSKRQARAAVIEECLYDMRGGEAEGIEGWRDMTLSQRFNALMQARKRRLTQKPEPVKTPEEWVAVRKRVHPAFQYISQWEVVKDGHNIFTFEGEEGERLAKALRLGLIAELTQAGKEARDGK